MDLIDRTKLPFEIGDEVTYAGDSEIHTIIGYFFSRGFNNYDCNYGYIIDNVITSGEYGLSNFCYDEIGRPLSLSESFYVLPSNLTLITEENMKEFTKKDLKTGMIVELTTGTRCLLVNNTLIGATGQMSLSNYDENLIYVYDNTYNINKVYLHKDHYWGLGFKETLKSLCGATLLWERPEIIEMSIEEIAEKLGIPANQLRIKK